MQKRVMEDATRKSRCRPEDNGQNATITQEDGWTSTSKLGDGSRRCDGGRTLEEEQGPSRSGGEVDGRKEGE